jgi:uncharacterized membrane protein
VSVADGLDPDAVGPERAWLAAAAGLVLAVVVGSAAFPRTVYEGFVWRYFWGPVAADANAAACAVRAGGDVSYLGSTAACSGAAGTVAYPGYTVVSEVGYAALLLFALAGVVLLLRRLDLGDDPRFVLALLPFVLFGGALRVVEDATDGLDAGVAPVLAYPWNAVVISPVIYLTVFCVTLAALLGSVALARRGLVADYRRPLLAAGLVVLAATLAYLASLSGVGGVAFHARVLAAVLVLATTTAAGAWLLLVRLWPAAAAGTGRVGPVVVWAHAVDGAANVVGLDWLTRLGAGPNLVPKHPLNRVIVETTADLLPAGVEAAVGSAWSFLLVKLLVAAVVVGSVDEPFVREHPRSATLLLLAVLAVGLGPGTRDALRATLGV